MRVSRLKTTYQRNMIIGQGVALSVAAIVFFWLGRSVPASIVVEQFEIANQKLSVRWSGQPEAVEMEQTASLSLP